MARRLNPAWMAEMEDALKRSDSVPVEYTSEQRLVIQYLVMTSDTLGVPCRVIKLGAGVQKFTTDVSKCPKCGGTGRC